MLRLRLTVSSISHYKVKTKNILANSDSKGFQKLFLHNIYIYIYYINISKLIIRKVIIRTGCSLYPIMNSKVHEPPYGQ